MIYFLILALALVIGLLFVDWSKVKLPFKMPERKTPPARPQSSVIPFQQESDSFPEVVDHLFEPVPTPTPQPTTSPEVEELLTKADAHFRKGEMKAAEDLYVQAAAKDPRCSKAYARLGVIYLEAGESYTDAEEAFRQALKTDPQNGYLLNNLGLVLYHQDKYADAIRQFEQAVRLDELNAARHANLGMAYLAMRQYAKAESSFKKALKLAPQEMEYKDLLNEAIEKKKAHKTMIRH